MHGYLRSGKATERAFSDYFLSRYACYLIALNGDPRKAEIAAAQNYFVITTREHELSQLLEEQQKRLELRERVAGNNRKLAQAAVAAGVLPAGFGRFQNAGYRGLYAGLDVAGIKDHKAIAPNEDILDRMGRTELAANDFRITQTEEKLRNEPITREAEAIETHYSVGQEVRQAMAKIGGRMPEDLPPEPSIRPLLDHRRKKKQHLPQRTEAGEESGPTQGQLC